MSKYGSSSSKTDTSTITAESTVTPAVGKTVAADTKDAQTMQNEARSTMRGIASTYKKYALANEETPSKSKLGE
jgi:hypothetical protein